MDDSFLSDQALVKASRNFICIRLATYEDAREAEFLKDLFRGRSGELENTVFALLDPAGKTRLSKTHRTPQAIYRSASAMARSMDLIAAKYPGNDSQADRLPQMSDLRLAVNVASCDGLPLVVAYDRSAAQADRFAQQLTQLAFAAELAGKFHFFTTTNEAEFKSIGGFESEPGIYLVQPGDYGMQGTAIRFQSDAMDAEALKLALVKIASQSRLRVKNHRQHVRFGNQNGKSWETAIPVTDPGSLRAMNRGR